MMDFFTFPNTPKLLGIYAFLIALGYFLLTIISPSLPPALLFSGLVGYVVYTIAMKNSNSSIKEKFINYIKNISSNPKTTNENN